MLANHKGEIPFVILLIPFIAGIGWSLYLPNTPIAALLTLLACLCVAFIYLNISYVKLKLYRFRWFGGILVHITLFCLGCALGINHNDATNDNHFSKYKAKYLVIEVNNEPVVKNGAVRFTVDVIKLVDSAAKPSAVVLIPARFNTVDPPFNPGEFNYKQYLAHQNIYHQAYLYPGQYVTVGRNAGNSIIGYSLKLRRRLVAEFNAHMRDSSAIAIASTMILGYKADLSDDVLQTYAQTGTLHVLSVSGAHVAIVFILLSCGLSFLNKVKHGKIIQTALIIILIWGYALLTGFSPAVCRAALMISLIISGNTFHRYINSLNLLAASAFGLLLYNPNYLMDVGFQLSYLAVGGLILFQPLVYNAVNFENKWIDKLWALCSVSIAAQVITFPLSAFYFHQFPVYFLLSNMFILLPVMIIMYLGLGFLLLCWIPTVSDALGYLLNKSISLMNAGLAYIEHLPFASVSKLWISVLDYTLLYCIIILGFYFLFNRNRHLVKLTFVLTFILAVSVSWRKIEAQTGNSITFLNLKKQRGIVFRSGATAVVLTDLKTTDKSYRYSIQPGLDSAKVAGVTVYKFDQNFDLPFMKKRGSLISFCDKSLIILDSAGVKIKANKPLSFDYAYLTHTPAVEINTLLKNFNAALLVISSDNSEKRIEFLRKQLLHRNNKYYLLKHNKALNLTTN